MNFFQNKFKILKMFGLFVLTILLVGGGSLFQQRVLEVSASVQVLLVSQTAIAFGQVFPGQDPKETYTVQLDTSANAATYVTTLGPLPELQNLCPFLNLHNIDSPAEPDTLALSSLSRPGDVLDRWQVELNVPGIKGELSQDHDGGIVVTGGNYGCKITVTTTAEPPQPGRIVVCKQSVRGTGTFNFTGSFDSFSIKTFRPAEHVDSSDCANIDSSSDDGFGTKVFENLSPGNYQLTEAAQDGWNLTSLTCDDPSHNSRIDGKTAFINLSAGESVVCHFVNTQKNGTIVIQKQTSDANGKFSFSGDLRGFSLQTQNGKASKSFDGLTPGSYTVSETPQEGWKLGSIVCTDPSHDTTTSGTVATIKLAGGETVTCLFTNNFVKQNSVKK